MIMKLLLGSEKENEFLLLKQNGLLMLYSHKDINRQFGLYYKNVCLANVE